MTSVLHSTTWGSGDLRSTTSFWRSLVTRPARATTEPRREQVQSMTDLTIQKPATRPVPLTVRLAVRDIRGITKRNLLRIIRTPQLLFVSILQPTIILLLFRYVLGGAIHVPGIDYVDFVVPGIFLEAVLIGGMTTALALAQDLQAGMIDRFRSLPIPRQLRRMPGRHRPDHRLRLRLHLGLRRHRPSREGSPDRPDGLHPAHVHPVLRQLRAGPGVHHARLAAAIRPEPAGHRHHQLRARALRRRGRVPRPVASRPVVHRDLRRIPRRVLESLPEGHRVIPHAEPLKRHNQMVSTPQARRSHAGTSLLVR